MARIGELDVLVPGLASAEGGLKPADVARLALGGFRHGGVPGSCIRAGPGARVTPNTTNRSCRFGWRCQPRACSQAPLPVRRRVCGRDGVAGGPADGGGGS